MNESCTIQVFHDADWHDAARVRLLGPVSGGWRAATFTDYEVGWAAAHTGKRGSIALSARWPVDFYEQSIPRWPGFLIDMLPHGPGRQFLLQRLRLRPHSEDRSDWLTLVHGGSNPIGNLRVKEAAATASAAPSRRLALEDEEIGRMGVELFSYLRAKDIDVTGAACLQGEWPKLLLTRGSDGLLYLDNTLPDDEAVQHYIVKFDPATGRELSTILDHELVYMHLAELLGLRVHAPLQRQGSALFIERFDRSVGEGGVLRFGQESVASLAGRPGFGDTVNHDDVCKALLQYSTSPEDDVLEYLKRDVANLALGNKDNHARNTAVQHFSDGTTRLSPLFDFAPMYLHPDGISRRLRWEAGDGGTPDWSDVIDSICALAQVAPEHFEKDDGCLIRRDYLVSGLQSMIPGLRLIADHGRSMGLSNEIHAHLRASLVARIEGLERLSTSSLH